MKLADLCRNGKEYDMRITKMIKKIASGGRFLLADTIVFEISCGLQLGKQCVTCPPDTIVFEQYKWSTVEEY